MNLCQNAKSSVSFQLFGQFCVILCPKVPHLKQDYKCYYKRKVSF